METCRAPDWRFKAQAIVGGVIDDHMQADRFVRIELRILRIKEKGMVRRSPSRKVTYFEPVLPRLARNTIIESTFEVGRRFRCTMRVDCGQLDPGAVIRPVPGEWHPRIPERLDYEELADWRTGRNAVYQLAALTIGARLAVADA
jgi:hypothetical protein